MQRPGHAVMKAGTRSPKPSHLANWLAHHIFCFIDSVKRLRQQLVNSIVTLLMIAVAFAVPLTIYAVVKQFSTYLASWDHQHEVTFFLTRSSNTSQANSLLAELNKEPYLSNLKLTPADQALQDFAARTALPVGSDLFAENPLPNLITGTANIQQYSAKELQQHLNRLSSNALIDQIVFDYVWLERLHAIIRVGLYLGVFLAILLSVTIVLVIINTVRWEIESRNDELHIIQLVGGTDSYIRRPFLYIGAIIGGLGAILAVMLVAIVLSLLGTSVNQLFELYSSRAPHLDIGVGTAVLLIVSGAGLGLAGAWVAASQKLRVLQ